MTARAIYSCPIKRPGPDHPSGLAQVASLCVQALKAANFEVLEPEFPLAYDRQGDGETQARLRDAARAAASDYVQDLTRRNIRPDLIVTYHSYYKSPDWIGPILAQTFGCPYAVIEASHAAHRAVGPFALGHAGNCTALQSADILFVSTARDRPGLSQIAGAKTRLVEFPPFIDIERFPAPRRPRDAGGHVRIISAGMMNDERKVQSYLHLLDALRSIDPKLYSLTIAGDGRDRAHIESAARALQDSGAQIHFLGALAPKAMPEFYASGDIFAWPGIGEAYGLVYLEAQAAGCPIIAEGHPGPLAVIAPPPASWVCAIDRPGDFAAALHHAITATGFRQQASEQARGWVLQERSVAAAARRLRSAFEGITRQ